MENNDDRPNEGQRLMVRSKKDDPMWLKANHLLSEIHQLKADRLTLSKQCNQLTERIDTKERELHVIILELEPTEVVTRKPKQPEDNLADRLKKALASRLAESPSLEEQLNKILGNK